MRLVVIAVGERLPDWADAAFSDYARRMPRGQRIELVAVRSEPRRETRTVAQTVAAEAARIQAAIPSGALRIALDEHGKDLDTEALSAALGRWTASGRDCAFLIGGPDGLAPELIESAAFVLRLSSLTLPHALARVILAEALYRAVSLLHHHPYHRS